MRKLIANLHFYLVCRWFGHTKVIWTPPVYRAWYPKGDLNIREESPWSGQCSRCWRVVAQRQMVVLKVRPLL